MIASLWWLLALGLVVGGALAHRRVRDKARLATPSAEPVGAEHRFVCAPGVELGAEAQRALSALARAGDWELLEVLPGRAEPLFAWTFASGLPDAFGIRRGAQPWTGCHAVLVCESLLERAGVRESGHGELAGFVQAVRALQLCAQPRVGIAVVPELEAVHANPWGDRSVLYPLFGAWHSLALPVAPAVLLALALGPFVSPLAGSVALLCYQVQQLALLGTPLATPALRRRLRWAPLLRWPLEVRDCARQMAGWRRDPREREVEALRPRYAEWLREGVSGFFEPRRTRCPLCEGAELQPRLSTVDLMQGKPGRFRIDRCAACGHLFQNPRLSAAGLDFYYRDFYDGLGASDASALFASAERVSGLGGADPMERVHMVCAHGEPARWLDVGCGHGHFCAAAAECLPETEFHGLDQSESVRDAARRGWIAAGHCEAFPAFAARAPAAFDVVSMNHYLEHTPDPRRELAAAAQALEPGGLLFIEVPDPECPGARWLGRYWSQWVQPQHLHLFSRAGLARLLREVGFEPLAWQRGPAHLGMELTAAGYLWLSHLAFAKRVPWRPPPSPARRLACGALWAVAAPLLLLALLLDGFTTPLLRRFDGANAYRVVARLRPAAPEL